MQYAIDIHSHSGYSGGVGQMNLTAVAESLRWKGIHAFGAADALQPLWRERLQKSLRQVEPGLFQLDSTGLDANITSIRFVLQTEIIITAAVSSGGRKGTHVVLTFPSFAAVDAVAELLTQRGTALNIGRPFVRCEDAADVAGLLYAIWKIDPSILIFPAHVLTPQGIYGSDHPIDSMADFFGESADRISIVETGLSADPQILALIPELDSRTLISNSDCHSAALNRVGREFTIIDVDTPSYEEIVSALRKRKIVSTAEFHPSEGRYFFTGHRPGLEGHNQGVLCYFSPDQEPADGICPICGKKLTIGVLSRALTLAKKQGAPERTLDNVIASQPYKSMAPLIEVIAASLQLKSITSKKVTALFNKVAELAGSESSLWNLSVADIEKLLKDQVTAEVLRGIIQVANLNFCFSPPGYDGEYGKLVLGSDTSWENINVIQR